MAINPATARLISQVAIKTLTDEEARQKVVLIVLAPIIAVLLVLTMFTYILTSPISAISEIIKDGNQKEKIKEFKLQNDSKIQFQAGKLVFHGKYPMPAEGKVTSPYGMRMHPIFKTLKMHTGIDIGTAWHSQVCSIADGQVVRVGVDSGYGNYIIIKHEMRDETFYSAYAHLSAVYAIKDQEVKQGSVIALEGGEPGVDPNPGNSTGHHLHFEIRENQSAISHIDPAKYLFQRS